MQINDYFTAILQPLPGERPCGLPLDYDADFILLQSKLQPRQGAEYGDFIEPPEPLNWSDIERDCLKLLAKSKDIRLIIALMRCRLRQTGVEAVEEGLITLYRLLTLFPHDLHPQLYDEGEYEPIFRTNALSELVNIQGFLTELRDTELPRALGMQLTIKDLENAKRPASNVTAFSGAQTAAMMEEWKMRSEPGPLSLQRAWYRLQDLKKAVCDIQGKDAPLFTELEQILQLFLPSELQQQTEKSQPMPDEEKHPSAFPQAETELQDTAQWVPAPQLLPPLQTRADALARLKELHAWFTEWEPSSPVILLLEFAVKVTGMRFPEIIKQFPREIIARLEGKEE